MSMTTEQAMKHFASHMKADADCYNMAAAKGYMSAAAVHKRDFEANQIAITALREKAEREDPKPLTLEELRQMDGEPVWIKANHYGIFADVVHILGKEDGDSFVRFKICHQLQENGYGKTWIAYRHKPKEVTE